MLLFLAFIQSQPISFLLKATQVFTELESPPGEIWYKYDTNMIQKLKKKSMSSLISCIRLEPIWVDCRKRLNSGSILCNKGPTFSWMPPVCRRSPLINKSNGSDHAHTWSRNLSKMRIFHHFSALVDHYYLTTISWPSLVDPENSNFASATPAVGRVHCFGHQYGWSGWNH